MDQTVGNKLFENKQYPPNKHKMITTSYNNLYKLKGNRISQISRQYKPNNQYSRGNNETETIS